MGLFLNVISIVMTFEKIYEHFEVLKEQVLRKLEVCKDKKERIAMKSALIKLSSVKPFSACGYFVITKETVTSMLSVRSVVHLKVDF